MTGLALAFLLLFAPSPDLEPGLREAVRRSPHSFEANFSLGEFLISKKKLSQAIPFLESAHRANPAHEGAGYDLVLAYLKTGAIDKARSRVNEMLAKSEAADLHNLLGTIENKAGNIITAGKEFERAAQMDPNERNLFDLGDHLLRNQGFEDALKVFRHGVGLFAGSPQLRVGLGVAQYSLGNYDDAVESLCMAVDLNPADDRPLDFLGRMRDISPKLSVEVTRRLAGFVERYPNNAQANYFYALSLWNRRDHKLTQTEANRVESLLKRAATLEPNQSATYYELGLFYEDRAQPQEAVSAYEQALKAEPANAKAHYRLGQLYSHLGRKEAARLHLAAYRRLHPN